MEKRIPFKNNCHNCHTVTLERIDLSKKRGNNELRWRQACFTSVASLQNGTDGIQKRLFWGSKICFFSMHFFVLGSRLSGAFFCGYAVLGGGRVAQWYP